MYCESLKNNKVSVNKYKSNKKIVTTTLENEISLYPASINPDCKKDSDYKKDSENDIESDTKEITADEIPNESPSENVNHVSYGYLPDRKYYPASSSGSVVQSKTTSGDSDRVDITPEPTKEAPITGFQAQASISTYQLASPLILGDLQFTTVIVGTAGRDLITGTEDGEAITARQAKDFIAGGGGSDAFIFETADQFGRKLTDTIADFDSIQGDVLVVSAKVFKGASKATLKTVAGEKNVIKAASTKYSFIYDTSTGFLYYNQNRKDNGFGDGGEFAQLLGAPDLSKNDFVIV
jgi:hypothetical protein